VEVFTAPVGSGGSIALTSTVTNIGWTPVADLQGGSDLWLLKSTCAFFVSSGGTALGAAHLWGIGVDKGQNAAATFTAVATHTIDSGASNQNRIDTQTINALLNNGTVHNNLRFNATKVGTPGDLFLTVAVTYRVVAT
jgi:hypothetical protein